MTRPHQLIFHFILVVKGDMSKTVNHLLFLLVIASGLAPCYGQGTLPNNLAFGEFKVGFQIFHEYDRRRSFLPKRDYYNARTDFEVSRPMQVAVWYPAATNTKATQLKYGSYIGLSSSEVDFAKNTKIDRSKLIDETIASFPTAAREKTANLFNSNINVFMGAAQRKGDFPLLLYAPPQDTSFYDNSVLCEYLASKGYIVVATTAKGEYTRLQGLSSRSIEVQAEDLGYLLDFGRRFTKSDKIGTFGFSRGGLSNLLFALKNKNIDATVVSFP